MMNKKLFGIALVALSLVAAPAVYAKKDSPKGKKIEKVAERKMCKAVDRGYCSISSFEGLDLTEKQKAEIAGLQKKQLETRVAERDARRAEKQMRKAERHKKDSARKEARRESRRSYLKELKKILGEDKYILFLENSYIDGKRTKKAHKAYTRKGREKGVRNGQRGGRKAGSPRITMESNSGKI